MQTDAEMPNDESMIEEATRDASEAAGHDDSSNEMNAGSDADAEMEASAAGTSTHSSKSKKSKKSTAKKSGAEKASKRSSKSSKKPVAEILNASATEAEANGADAQARDGLATDAEITEAIESVSSATQVAWEAAHLNFEEKKEDMPETDPETDPEAETADGKMAADSDSATNDNEIEETEVDLDSLITSSIEQSIEQMGFAALESSENSSEDSEDEENSEINFLSGDEIDGEEIDTEINGDETETNDLDAALSSHDETELDASADDSDDGEIADIDASSDETMDDPADNDADAQPTEFIEADHLVSIVESMLFSTDKPVSIATIKQMFKGSNVRTKDITRALDILASDYAAPTRGVTLEEINGGFQLRSKVDNGEYLRRLQKSRPFRLSGPALEVMSIVAYKQPVTKHEIDEIRGVESGHLLRALMERGMVNFAGKSDLPGKPMAYGTTRKFLEIFGLRNLKELPTLSEIDEILPQGIGETEEKEKLSDLTGQLSTELTSSYSEGEDELDSINSDLLAIDTTSEFFEQEKVRERDRRDRDKAQDLREKIVMGDEVEEKDRRWLDRYEAKLLAMEQAAASGTPISIPNEEGDAAPEIGAALEQLSADADGDGETDTDTGTDVEVVNDGDSEMDDDSDDMVADGDDETNDAANGAPNSNELPSISHGLMEGTSLDDMPKFEASAEIITPESIDGSEEIANEESDMLDDLEAVLDWNEDEESDESDEAFRSSEDSESDEESDEEADLDLAPSAMSDDSESDSDSDSEAEL